VVVERRDGEAHDGPFVALEVSNELVVVKRHVTNRV
jgi:hypothetical protein